MDEAVAEKYLKQFKNKNKKVKVAADLRRV